MKEKMFAQVVVRLCYFGEIVLYLLYPSAALSVHVTPGSFDVRIEA